MARPFHTARGTSRHGNAGRSATARASGREFEQHLDATHQALAARGVPIAVARAHPPVSGNPVTGLYYAGKGQVDFVGVLGGRPVAFDAKSEAGAASYRHDPDDAHELDFLLAWRRAGGLAFLLVRDRELSRVYLVHDLAALRRGESVPLREHARSGAAPVVPALHVLPDQVLARAVTGQPVWDWTALIASEVGALV